MKYILFILLVTSDGTSQIHTQEFDSRSACESAGERVIDELRRTPNRRIGSSGSRTWCMPHTG